MRCGLEQIVHRAYSARDLRSVHHHIRSATKAGSGELEDLPGGLLSVTERSLNFLSDGRKTNATRQHSIVCRPPGVSNCFNV